MRIFRRHTERPETTPQTPWINPFGTVAIDTEKVLDEFRITMQSGELKNAALKTAEDLQPIVARKIAVEALTNWLIYTLKSNCEELEKAQSFLDILIPPQTIDLAEEAIEEHSKKLRFSLHLLEMNNDDPDQAIKAGVEAISQSVEDDYTAACTPDAQEQLGQQFVEWSQT